MVASGAASGAVSDTRRNVLLGAGAALTGLAMPVLAKAPAAPNPLDRLLKTALPPEIRALIPGEVFEAGQFVSSLIALESEAGKLKLPPSKLSFGEAPLPNSLDRLYELAMPRLVALVDRSELRNVGLADQAGGLLSKLHRTQHVLPASFEALRLPGERRGLLQLDQGADEPPGLELPKAVAGQAELPPVDLPSPDEIAPGAGSPGSAAPPVRRSVRFADLAEEYAATFKAAQLLPAHRQSTDWHLTMMRQSRPRYEAVGKRNGVPWFFIAAIHALEASFNFRGHLHNGDAPLTQRTRQVPAGRPLVWGPPSDWESSATDALRLMGFAQASDWSLARTLYRLEAYNGFGYRRIGRVSPYLWSFSSVYTRGKFVADGRYNPNARSSQCGAAVMLKLLVEAGEIELA